MSGTNNIRGERNKCEEGTRNMIYKEGKKCKKVPMCEEGIDVRKEQDVRIENKIGIKNKDIHTEGTGRDEGTRSEEETN